MDAVLGVVSWIFWTFVGILWWVVSQLLWIAVWLLLPLAIAAFLALRLAERVFGQELVRAWVKARASKLGEGTWHRLRRALFALGVLPIRVIGWFVVYALWHSVVSLFWRPRWKPWPRAWAKRWRRRPAPT